ncbi:membrane metallo-endopeptidase-like 1 [Plakobranchus ocellatus]|uniref:Membrane metallo-endopeptidase-like 1 n=1 Tax=Plakobranchus ocellatus TaxID=259542 RepID=A0AAV3ZPH8_9GAST|nr:membrane metallo-endopeptidase-like 1 [Plakobranchus ocellatus]
MKRLFYELFFYFAAIVSEDPKPGDWAYVNNTKNLYKSCMDEEGIEEIGVKPYLNTSYSQEWPTLIGQNWTGESQFDLNDVITRYFGVFVEPIASVSLRPDPMNSSRYAIYLDDPALFLPRTYFIRPRNDSVLMAYERYLRDTAIYLGAEHDVAAKDAADVLDLEIKLAKIDIPRGLRASFAIANLTLGNDQEIIVLFPSYYSQLEGVINSTDKRTLQNIFGFKYALSKVRDLTEKLRQISFDLLKDTLELINIDESGSGESESSDTESSEDEYFSLTSDSDSQETEDERYQDELPHENDTNNIASTNDYVHQKQSTQYRQPSTDFGSLNRSRARSTPFPQRVTSSGSMNGSVLRPTPFPKSSTKKNKPTYQWR